MVASSEVCEFCGAATPPARPAPGRSAGRLTRAALVAFGATLAAAGCDSAPAPVYGAPPMPVDERPAPVYGGPPFEDLPEPEPESEPEPEPESESESDDSVPPTSE